MHSHDLVGLPVLFIVITVMDLLLFFSRFALDRCCRETADLILGVWYIDREFEGHIEDAS